MGPHYLLAGYSVDLGEERLPVFSIILFAYPGSIVMYKGLRAVLAHAKHTTTVSYQYQDSCSAMLALKSHSALKIFNSP